MKSTHMLLLVLATVGLPAVAQVPPLEIAGADVEIACEVLAIGKEGVRLQQTMAVKSSGLPTNPRLHAIIRLGTDGTSRLVYVVEAATHGTEVELTLDRELHRSGTPEKLPPVSHRMSLFDCWNTTLLADNGAGSRLDLRVVARLGERREPALLEGKAFKMRLSGGPLVRRRPPGTADVLVLTEVNSTGHGLSFGLPGVGVVKLSPLDFPGAGRCGVVAGSTMGFSFGEASYQLWSGVPILPEGEEWILFGTLEPFPEGEPERLFYGGFNVPGVEPASRARGGPVPAP